MANAISEHILLTGAGFTANFNGFLAEGMWSEIFNHPEIQYRDNIKKMMVMDFDYETLYHKIIKSQSQGLFSDDDKKAIKKAVHDAYLRLDDLIRNYNIHNFDNLPFAIRKLFGPQGGGHKVGVRSTHCTNLQNYDSNVKCVDLPPRRFFDPPTIFLASSVPGIH